MGLSNIPKCVFQNLEAYQELLMVGVAQCSNFTLKELFQNALDHQTPKILISVAGP